MLFLLVLCFLTLSLNYLTLTLCWSVWDICGPRLWHSCSKLLLNCFSSRCVPYFVHTYLRKQTEMINKIPHMIPSPWSSTDLWARLSTWSACSFDSIWIMHVNQRRKTKNNFVDGSPWSPGFSFKIKIPWRASLRQIYHDTGMENRTHNKRWLMLVITNGDS